MEQKHNKQLHTEEYSSEYSAHGQQLIYEAISGIFLEYSWNILHVRLGPKNKIFSKTSYTSLFDF